MRGTKIAKDEVFQNVGNSAGALAGAPKSFKATYDFAVHTHGSMGPSCAVAEVKDGKLTVWTASQATHLLRKQLARMLDMADLNVRCIYLEGSGCYGRNGHEDAAADAALVAKEIGKPVRVQWSRADEHGWDPKGPPTLLDYRGAIDASGNVVAWESEVFIPDRPAAIEVELVAAELANLPTARRAPRQHPPVARDPVRAAEHQGDRALARRDAVPAVVDPHAGADAEHLRQRVLPRRAGGGGGRRSARVPASGTSRIRAGSSASSGCGSSPTGRRARSRPAARARSRRGAACRTSSTSSCAPTSRSSPTSR